MVVRIVKILLLTSTVTLIAATATLSTQFGQSALLQVASTLSSGEDSAVRIGKLKGSLFSNGTISEITLTDRQGAWLEARGISFSWGPSQLLSGRLSVAYLRAETISVLRKPLGDKNSGSADVADDGSDGLGLPLELALNELSLQRVSLSDAIAGEPATLSVTGNAQVSTAAKTSTAQLQVSRLDGVGGDLKAQLEFVAANRTLAVAVDGSEPANGVVSRLLGLPTRPPVSLKLHADGGLDAWRADLSLAADGQPFVAGNVRLDAVDARTHLLAGSIAGYVDTMVPPAVKSLFSGRTVVAMNARVTGLAAGEPDAVSDARVSVDGDNMRVVASGGANVSDGYVYGQVEGRAGKDGGALAFGAPEGPTVSLRDVSFKVVAPETSGRRRVMASAGVSGLSHPQLAAEQISLSATADQPSASGSQALVFNAIEANVTATGINDTPLGKALGQTANAVFAGGYDGSRLTFDKLDVDTGGAKLAAKGTLEGQKLLSKASVTVSDLSRYAELAGRALAGKAAFDLDVDADLQTQAVAVSLLGKSQQIALGISAADRLLAPATTYRAVIELGADGSIRARNTAVENAMLTAALDAVRSKSELDVDAQIKFASLDAVDPSLSGKGLLKVDISGPDDDLATNVLLTGEGVTFNGKSVDEPRISIAGRGPLARHVASIEIGASLAKETISGSAAVTVSPAGESRVDDLNFEIAGAKLDGRLSYVKDALPTGIITLDAPRLARIGKALGMAMKGKVSAKVELGGRESGVAKLDATAQGISIAGVQADTIRANADVTDYPQAPLGKAKLTVHRAAQGQTTLSGLTFDTEFKGASAAFTSKGRLDGARFSFAGDARATEAGHEIKLSSLSYVGKAGLPPIRLAAPAVFAIQKGDVSTRGIQMAIGEGALTAKGKAGSKALGLEIALKNLPASIAGVAGPDLGLTGTINGTASVAGSPSDPRIDANLKAASLTVSEMRRQQLPSADITAGIKTATGNASVNIRATARGGLDLAVDGRVGMKGDGRLALKGRGQIPLKLANVFLADRAARLAGTASLTADVSGRLSAPVIDGRILLNDASAADPGTGLDLSDIDADIAFARDRVSIRNLVAVSRKGGQMSADGNVSLPEGAAPRIDVGVKLASFKFGNQDPVAGEIDGRVKLTGPLTALVARGNVQIRRMDITVPNSVPQSVEALDLRHVNAPPRFADRSEKAAPTSETGPAPAVSLFVDVRAADRIFVRGRGLDAQLGGALKIRGTAESPVTDGQFSMSRGRLSIIGRQLDFSRGNIVFTGGLEPSLDMEAKADADGTTVIVQVTGPASKPQIRFTSSPELPEDEIVSLLLFNKKLAKLSPAQLIQLAGEIDKIGGLSSGPSTLDQLKSTLGVDVFDVTTDEKGNAQASAGSYINENTYVGVKQGTDFNNSRIVIDHNLTKNIKARGEAGSDGNSKLGLGFEWDY